MTRSGDASAARAPSGTPRAGAGRLAGWIFLAALLGYAALVHYGVGPPAGRIARHWYEPRGFLIDVPLLAPLLATPLRAMLWLGAPALLLAGAVFLSTRSAVARATALSCVAAILVFVFYGVQAPFVWKFFRWRASLVLCLAALCVGFSLAAPLLATSWLRRGWALRFALYAPAVVAVLALVRNTTGTDPTLPFAISPWPALPIFGLEVGALFASLWLLGLAIGAGGVALARTRSGPTAAVTALAAPALGAVVPAALVWLAAQLGALPFQVGGRTGLAVALACAVGIVVTALSGPAAALRVRAGRLALGAALILVPLVAAEALAWRDYRLTRDERAQRIVDALQAHFEEEGVYPDELSELVEAGRLERIPEPAIGFRPFYAARFQYENFGTSFLLEFPAPRWVQCAYTPPYEDEEEDEGDALEGAWSCPSTPPELW